MSITPSLESTIANGLSTELREELVGHSDAWFQNNKRNTLNLISRLIAEADDIPEDLGAAVDYLQCQIEHKEAQDAALRSLDYSTRFQGEFGDLRYEIRRLIEPLMENLRHGKRSEEIDRILSGLTALSTLANQAPTVQPVVNFAGIEGALSPRCHTCEAPCRSAVRLIHTFLRKVIRELKSDDAS